MPEFLPKLEYSPDWKENPFCLVSSRDKKIWKEGGNMNPETTPTFSSQKY